MSDNQHSTPKLTVYAKINRFHTYTLILKTFWLMISLKNLLKLIFFGYEIDI